MKSASTTSRFLALLLIALAGYAAGISAQTREQSREQARAEFHESYPLAQDGIVSVSNSSGNIRVTSWNENRVQVDAVKRARRSEDLPLVEIQVTARPERIEILSVYPPRRSTSVSVDYEIKVPRSAILGMLKTSSGNVDVQGAVARVVANVSSGNITARNIVGDANLTASTGNITAERISGTLGIRASSGDLFINDVGSQLVVYCSSGNIQATQIKGDTKAETSSGDLKFEHMGGRVTANSASGAITVRDVSGDVRANNYSETITVENVRGRATLTSLSGRVIARNVQEGVTASSISSSVEISGSKGRIEANATSGLVILRDIDSRDVRASSINSGVRFQGKIYNDGRYEFSSMNAEIILILPPDSGFNLTAKTSLGEIITDFPIELGRNQGYPRRIEGTYGKGGAQIIATSYNGSINLKKAVGGKQ